MVVCERVEVRVSVIGSVSVFVCVCAKVRVCVRSFLVCESDCVWVCADV